MLNRLHSKIEIKIILARYRYSPISKMESKMEFYYVVKKGHQPGIYKTWPECKKAVEGFKGPIYKKFPSFEEASAFYKSPMPSGNKSNLAANTIEKLNIGNGNGNSNTTSGKKVDPLSVIPEAEILKIRAVCSNIKSAPFSEDLNYKPANWNCINDEIYIFTDGSAKKPTGGIQSSGVGVYLGHGTINVKEYYEGRECKTNNQCELLGLDYAFKLIVNYFPELLKLNKNIKIVSDSEYAIKACSIWLQTWKGNNWKTSGGEDVKNRDLIESIDSSMNKIKSLNAKIQQSQSNPGEPPKIRVKLVHVCSHQVPDLTDKFKFNLWFGNYVADLLAQNII